MPTLYGIACLSWTYPISIAQLPMAGKLVNAVAN